MFLIIFNVHILQPVPGGSSSRAMPMDVDNHQGQFLLMYFHISYEGCSNFKPLLAGMKNLYGVQIDNYYFIHWLHRIGANLEHKCMECRKPSVIYLFIPPDPDINFSCIKEIIL